MWRKYREKNGLDSDDEEELRRNVIALIPERKTQKNRTESKNKSDTFHLELAQPKLALEDKNKLSIDNLSVAQPSQEINSKEYKLGQNEALDISEEKRSLAEFNSKYSDFK